MASTTSRRRHVHLGLTALLLLTALLGSLAAPEAAEARNAPKVRGKTITIKIPIDVYLLPGVADTFPARLQSAFDTYWGEGNGFEYKCYDVVFKLDMEVVQTLPPDDAPRHRVVVEHVPEGERGPTRRVDYGPNKQGNDRPTEGSYQGDFADHEGDDNLWAHEFGHFMGLDDEYTDNGKRGTERRTRPWPGADKDGVPYKDSLMADGGPVRQRYIDQIVERHFPDGAPKCKFRARQVTSYDTGEINDAIHRQRMHGWTELEVWAEETEDGTIEGWATYTGMDEFWSDKHPDHCTAPTLSTGDTTEGTLTWEAQNLTVRGRREGDHVELVVEGDLHVTGVSSGTSCGSEPGPPWENYTVETTQAFYTPVPLAGELVGGRYEAEQTFTYNPYRTDQISTLIEEVPADEEGEAVG
jgi:hypothetical protein